MREAAFIKENREKWEKIDGEKTTNLSAEELADNFIELTDDLSFARTFYPKSQTEGYLNQLAAKYFTNIYKHKKREKGRFKKFWLTELPLTMYKHREKMLYSFVIFLLGILLGVFSMAQDSSFANLILGDSYVNMTTNNIDKGDPMAVYKNMDESPMFFAISSNNIMVAFYAFIYGIFLSVGTAYIMFSNGVMLGAFQTFFYQKGLLGTSMLSIWLHGTLEISAIIIAGGAGFILGNSLLYPKTHSRKESLVIAAKDALKIVVGLIPVFIVAGFIESFLTRKTEMPIILNILIIGLSLAFIVYYFFYYPHQLNKKRNG